jgi:sulfopyruvate decarboxylase TPP-binding subunit
VEHVNSAVSASPGVTAVLQTAEDGGVTHVTGIPDNTSAPLFDALEDHDGIRLVRVTREGEAIAIASGLWLGGARPLVVIQSTGLLESGDALRGTAVRMGAPIPLVVTARGYAKMRRAGLTPGEALTPELLQRPDVDSVALLVEPTLSAWGVPFEVCEEPPRVSTMLARALRRARDDGHPAVLLLATGLD